MEQSSTQGINTYYYHINALGSTIAITDNTGAIAERYEYDVYGAVNIYNAAYTRLEYSAISNTYLFTGREYDAESGLYYYRTRHYNPQLGRFMQRDMIGIWGDIMNRGNGYGYVGNNGVNWVDPWGLLPSVCWNNFVNTMAAVDFAYDFGMTACNFSAIQDYVFRQNCRNDVTNLRNSGRDAAIATLAACKGGLGTRYTSPDIFIANRGTKDILLSDYSENRNIRATFTSNSFNGLLKPCVKLPPVVRHRTYTPVSINNLPVGQHPLSKFQF